MGAGTSAAAALDDAGEHQGAGAPAPQPPAAAAAPASAEPSTAAPAAAAAAPASAPAAPAPTVTPQMVEELKKEWRKRTQAMTMWAESNNGGKVSSRQQRHEDELAELAKGSAAEEQRLAAERAQMEGELQEWRSGEPRAGSKTMAAMARRVEQLEREALHAGRGRGALTLADLREDLLQLEGERKEAEERLGSAADELKRMRLEHTPALSSLRGAHDDDVEQLRRQHVDSMEKLGAEHERLTKLCDRTLKLCDTLQLPEEAVRALKAAPPSPMKVR